MAARQPIGPAPTTTTFLYVDVIEDIQHIEFERIQSYRNSMNHHGIIQLPNSEIRHVLCVDVLRVNLIEPTTQM
jgi:hypothetical protein